MRPALWVGALAVLLVGGACARQSVEPAIDLRPRLEAFLGEQADVPAVAIVILDRQGREVASGAAGVASPAEAGKASFTVDTPLRIASITKTCVAATVLRLWEAGRLDLDAGLDGYIDANLDALLRSGGYVPAQMTIRQLLSHSAGLFDYAATESYLQQVVDSPQREWTRMDQIRFAMAHGEPLAAPGRAFHYSDTGYLILAHVIERESGLPLAGVVREQLGFAALGLAGTWWELAEAPPDGALPRAHQFLGGLDTHAFHPSMDLHGGGGLVASVRDVAVFAGALFGGRVFERAATLSEMMAANGPGDPGQYRLGLQVGLLDGRTTLGHHGFWGLAVHHLPEEGLTIAGAVTEQQGAGALAALMDDLVAELAGT